MKEIIRTEIDEMWAHYAVVEAGDYVYISYCMKNEGESIENQINGAFDVLSERLERIGLTLESVVQMDCLFRDINELLYLGDIIKERFHSKYPARKAYETRFIRDGIAFQVDAVAFKGR
ncbi:MAG: RidA family protein [Candidatus Galacturonibacter soehngenii]|nr:RidA family protein [Candidatus Galacturonibacter soehngenii]